MIKEAICLGERPDKTKIEIAREIKEKIGVDKAIIVGDRIHDIEVARELGDPSIGASYGYGSREEIAQADYVIDEFSELRIIME